MSFITRGFYFIPNLLFQNQHYQKHKKNTIHTNILYPHQTSWLQYIIYKINKKIHQLFLNFRIKLNKISFLYIAHIILKVFFLSSEFFIFFINVKKRYMALDSHLRTRSFMVLEVPNRWLVWSTWLLLVQEEKKNKGRK